MKYSLPVMALTLMACSTTRTSSISAHLENTVISHRSPETENGVQLLLIAAAIAQQGQCQVKAEETRDCYGSLPLTERFTATRALYRGNTVSVEIVPAYNGIMGEIKTPSGETKVGKIEILATDVGQIDPPRFLVRTIEGTLTFYEPDQQGKWQPSRTERYTKCYDANGKQFPPNLDKKCILP